MKKYLLMLAAALVMPLLITSCKNDDPEPGEDFTFQYAFPVTNWGTSVSNVKASMANLGLSLNEGVQDALIYFTPNDFFPAYTYIFSNNTLSTSSLTLSEEQDEEYDFQGAIEKLYGQPTGEDEEGWFYSNGTTDVYYTYSEELEGWMAAFTPATKSEKAPMGELVKKNVELLKSVK